MISSSKYFQALLGPSFKEGHEQEVTISNIDGPTLKAIIDYCYSGNLKISGENIDRMVAAASAMKLVPIEKKCEQFWNDHLAPSNCVETFVAADKYSFSDLREKSFGFICEHFEALSVIQIQELEMKHFFELLGCAEIQALEEHIFQRLVQWTEHNEEERSKHVPDLIKLIEMGKIPLPVRSQKNCCVINNQ